MLAVLQAFAEVYARPSPPTRWGPGLRPGVNRFFPRGWTSLSVQRLGDQPWRCLWRGSAQMTMTRPCRRITRHLLQIRLTLGLTFTGFLFPVASTSLVPVDDAATGQVVRGKLHDDPVLRQDADVVLPHLAADVRQYLVAVGELHPEHGVREWLDDPAFDLDGPVFFGHVLRYLTSHSVTGSQGPSRAICTARASRGSVYPPKRGAGMTERTLCAERQVYAYPPVAANPAPAVGCVEEGLPPPPVATALPALLPPLPAVPLLIL